MSAPAPARLRIHDAIAYWAARKPDAPALINFDRGRTTTWRELAGAVSLIARNLARLGIQRGDYVAASLPFLTEHVLFEYAVFSLGAVHVPLDPRLKPADVIRALDSLKPKAFVYLGPTRAFDFRELAKALQPHCGAYVQHWIQMSPPEDCLAGSIPFGALLSPNAPELAADPAQPDDGALVIFTTGSTGSPKPALLSHRNITAQNEAIGTAFDFNPDSRVLVNLPPFHVGGQTEELMTALYKGGAAVLLEVFDAARSLEAIERERVTLIGQIPAMFQLEWRQPDFATRDLSSLRTVIYGGQEVSRQFLDRASQMAPCFGTGLGLTECAGFCTYTRMGASLDEIASNLGYAWPDYPLSIRGPMHRDGSSGDELPVGEIGHVCFRGAQTFLGYVNHPDATARTISTDGYLYTGDLGSVNEHGALRFSGRAKFVIKPAGHQVFPGDVERHLAALEEKVACCGVVGAKHNLLSEAIVAFVEKRPGAELSDAELRKHAREMISYMRPLHYVILEPGGLPLNATTKTDYLKLAELAGDEVGRLRAQGRWDH